MHSKARKMMLLFLFGPRVILRPMQGVQKLRKVWRQNGQQLGWHKRSLQNFCIQLGVWESGYWMLPIRFYHDRPLLPWQRNLR